MNPKSAPLEIVARAGIYGVTTASGSTWVQLSTLGTITCNQVTLVNNTGTAIDASYCLASDGSALSGQTTIKIPDGAERRLRGIGDASQVRVKRNDNGTTTVTLQFIAEGVSIG